MEVNETENKKNRKKLKQNLGPLETTVKLINLKEQ